MSGKIWDIPLNDQSEVTKANTILYRLATALRYPVEEINGVNTIMADPEEVLSRSEAAIRTLEKN